MPVVPQLVSRWRQTTAARSCRLTVDRLDVAFVSKAVGGSEGLPVAVQCVALPWQDELCLRFMKEVERLVQQSRK